MIKAGKIGGDPSCGGEVSPDWVISSLVQEKSDQAKWRFDPQIIGASLCTGDIGTHLEQLIAQSTGLTIKSVAGQI